MTRRLILFCAWCLFLVTLSGIAAWYAWSPFSDDERPTSTAYRGPTHK